MEHARPPAELNMDGGPACRADAWKRWRQQFILFVKASGVHTEPSSVQASLLVNLIGPEGFDIYQTFNFEKEEDRDNVQKLLDKFDNYFGSKVNVTLLRYKFFSRNQEEGETIQQYVTSLRLLSKNCQFNKLEEDLIKDRIVCGVRSTTVRDRLLRCDDLNLEKVIRICQAEEVSLESGRQLSSGGASASVVHVDGVGRRGRIGNGGSQWARGGSVGGSAPPRRAAAAPAAGRTVTSWRTSGGDRSRGAHAQPAYRRPACGGCGSAGGARCAEGQCPALHVECFVCGNRGHFARVCKSNVFNNRGRVKKVYEIERGESDGESDDQCESFFISVIKGQKHNHDEWFERLSCGNGTENFKLDTGADVNVLSYEKFLILGFNENIIKKSNIKLQSYSGNVIPIKGVCYLECSYKNIVYNLKFAIANLECQSVLGRNSCEEIGLVKRVHSINLTDFEDLFTGVGCLPGKYHIVIDPTVRPVICASRKIPLGLRDRLADELKKMEQLGVIKRVSHPTQWVHPLVLAAKKNNGIRVCLDPRELNRAVQRAHFQLPTVTELAARLHGARFFSVLDANSGFWAVQLDEESADLCTFCDSIWTLSICSPTVWYQLRLRSFSW